MTAASIEALYIFLPHKSKTTTDSCNFFLNQDCKDIPEYLFDRFKCLVKNGFLEKANSLLYKYFKIENSQKIIPISVKDTKYEK